MSYQETHWRPADRQESPTGDAERIRRWKSWRQWKNAGVLLTYLPGLRWMGSYDFGRSFVADLVAGLTVGVMAIPQSTAFASMAGLPAAFGLYCCFVPPIVYAFFGGSRFLAVGPVALVSLILNDNLSQIVPGSDTNTNPNRPADPAAQDSYNRAAIQVSLLAGIIYVFLGAARLGFACNLLSRPIISSFLTAGAILISLSQVKHLLGIEIPRGNRLTEVVSNLASNLHLVRWSELVMGTAWLLLLHLVRNAPQWHRSLERVGCMGPITVAVLSISLVWGLGLDEAGSVQVIGSIQQGLPPLTLSWWLSAHSFWGLLRTAGVVVLVSLLEAISIAKALGERHGDLIDADTEIRGLAASNVVGAVFAAYPSTGSFARSAVSCDSGAKTGLAGLIVASVVGAVLLLLVPIFEHMPMNAMAAIVIMGVLGLLDFSRAAFYWKVSKPDFLAWVVTFSVALLADVDLGLMSGILLSLLSLFARAAFIKAETQALCAADASSNGSLIGRLDMDGGRTASAGCQDAGPAAPQSLLVLRPEGPLCFANVQSIQEQGNAALSEAASAGTAQRNAVPLPDEESAELLVDSSDASAGHQNGEQTSDEEKASAVKGKAARLVKLLVLDLRCSFYIDATAAEVLLSWQTSLEARGVRLGLAHACAQVLHTCRQSGLLECIGKESLFSSLQDAAQACDRLAAKERCRT